MRKGAPAVVVATSIIAIALFLSQGSAEAILLQGTFTDDNNSPHQNGIEAVAAAGITEGCNPPTNDRYCPHRNMTRAETATFLSRAFGLPQDGNDYFVDDDGHLHEGGINRIAAAGITTGCNPPANDRYCPDRDLTRAEFAAFMVRTLDLPPTARDYFSDDNGHVLETSINRIAEAGLTVGCNPPANSDFCPNRILTRGETATLVTRALRLDHNPQRIPLTEWPPITCDKDGKTCAVTIETFSGRTHFVEEGLFQRLPYAPGEESEFTASGSSFSLTLNGAPVAMNALAMSTTATEAQRLWTTKIVFSNGNQVLVGEWRWNGTLIQRTTVTLSVG
jgi:hypothetical protein